jgi:hypothetical protein
MKYEITAASGYCSCEEDVALGDACGAVLDRTVPGIPHADYRVLVMRTVMKFSSNPSTKDFAVAKAMVDRELKQKGIGIIIPAARPGRRTV